MKRQANIFASMITNINDMRKATESATNSAGSAAKEQAKYMQSLEYKSAQAKNAMIGFWQATVNSELASIALQTVTALAKAFTGLVNSVGLLTPVLTVGTGALLIANKAFAEGYLRLISFATGVKGLSTEMSAMQNLTKIFASVSNAINNLFKAETWKKFGASAASVFASIRTGALNTITTIRLLGAEVLKGNINWKAFGTTASTAFRVVGVAGVTALRGIAAAAITVATALAPLLLITGITLAIQKFYEVWQKNRTAAADRVKALKEESEEYRQNAEQIKNLSKELEILEAKTAKTADEQERLLSVQHDLNGMIPQMIKRYDEHGNAVYKDAQEVRALTEEMEKANAERARLIADQSPQAGTTQTNNIKKAITNLEKESNKIVEIQRLIETTKKNLEDVRSGVRVDPLETQDESIAKYSIQLLELERQLTNHRGKVQEIQDGMVSDQQFWAEALNARVDSVVKGAKIGDKNFELAMRRMADALANSGRLATMSGEEFNKFFKNFIENAVEANKNGTLVLEVGMDQAAQDAALAWLREYKFTAQEAATFLNVFRTEQKDLAKDTWDFATRMDELIAKTEGLNSGIDELAKAYDTLDKEQALSASQILKLIKLYPQIGEKLKYNQGIMSLTKDVIKEVADAEQKATKVEIENLSKREKARLMELENRKSVALAQLGIIEEVTQAEINSAEAAISAMLSKNPNLINDLGGMQQFQMMRSQLTKDLQPLLNDIRNSKSIVAGYEAVASTDFFATNLGAIQSGSGAGDKEPPEPFVEDAFADRLAINEVAMAKVREEMERTSKTSVRYKELVNDEIALLKQRQEIYHQNANALRTQRAEALASVDAASTVEDRNKFLQEADQAEAKIFSLQQNWLSAQSEINKHTIVDEKHVDSIALLTEALTDALNVFDQRLAESSNRMNLAEEGTKSWREEMLLTNSILFDKINILNQTKKAFEVEEAAIQSRLDTEKDMTESVRQLLTDRLKGIRDQIRGFNKDLVDLTASIIDNNKAMSKFDKDLEKNLEDLADKAVDAYRAILKERKRLQEEALDAEEEAEKRRHESVMDNLDSELKQYERVINERLALIDAEQSSKDFNRDMEKAIQERNDVQKQIDILALDNSIESQSKLADLRKKLADQDEKIEELKEKRKTQLRKDALKEELDTYKDGVDKKKRAEDDLNKKVERGFEDRKKKIEEEYETEYNNQERISEIRRKVMEGDFEWLKIQLNSYFETYGTLVDKVLGNISGKVKSILDLSDDIKELIKEAEDFDFKYGYTFDKPSPSGGLTGGGGTSATEGHVTTGSISSRTAVDKLTFAEAQEEHRRNAVAWWKEYSDTGNMSAELAQRNKDIRSAFTTLKEFQFNELSGDLAGIKNDTFAKYIGNKIKWQRVFDETGKMDTPDQKVWADQNKRWRDIWKFEDVSIQDILTRGLDKIAKFHKGGYTGNFPGEKFALLKAGEQIFDPEDTQRLLSTMDIVDRIAPAIKDFGRYLTGSRTMSTAVAGGPVVNIRIDRLIGTEENMETLSSKIVGKIKRKGKVF